MGWAGSWSRGALSSHRVFHIHPEWMPEPQPPRWDVQHRCSPVQHPCTAPLVQREPHAGLSPGRAFPSFLRLSLIFKLKPFSASVCVYLLGGGEQIPAPPVCAQSHCKQFANGFSGCSRARRRESRRGTGLGCCLRNDCLQASNSGCRQGPIDSLENTERFSC